MAGRGVVEMGVLGCGVVVTEQEEVVLMASRSVGTVRAPDSPVGEM